MSHFRVTLSALLLGTTVVSAQQPGGRLNFRELTAPAEVLACLPITIADEADETAERAIAEADRKTDQEARRLGMTKIGYSFVRGVRGAPAGDAFPVILDLCSGIEAAPTQGTEFEIREVPSAIVNVAYCASVDSEECLTSARTAAAPRQPAILPDAGSRPAPPSSGAAPNGAPSPTPAVPPLPVFPRFAFWFEGAAPTSDRDLLRTVYGFRDVNSLTEQAARVPRGIVIAVPKSTRTETDARGVR
jgi:hypothetical protein